MADGPMDLDRSWIDRVMRAVLWSEQWYGQGSPPSNDGQVLPHPPCVGFSPGVTIPAYGVFVASQSTTDPGQPAGPFDGSQATVHGGGSLLLINEGSDVASGESGVGWLAPPWWPAWALYDSADGTPEPGEAWGVKANSFKLGRGLPGFQVVATDSGNKRVLVLRTPGDDTRTATLATSLGTGSGTATLWYLNAPTSLTISPSDDMLGAGDTIPSNTMITVQFWPHARAWKVLNATCPAGS